MIEIITDLNILRSYNSNASKEEAYDIIKKLEISLKNSKEKGIGLAAPQIGINKRVAIIRTEQENIDLINPIIIEQEDGFINFNEGCLSVPKKRFNTQRFKEIFIKDDMHLAGIVAIGDIAVVILHEIDHLDGILIMDRSIGNNKIGRNDPCPCGRMLNNKPIKWKKCHGKN